MNKYFRFILPAIAIAFLLSTAAASDTSAQVLQRS